MNLDEIIKQDLKKLGKRIKKIREERKILFADMSYRTRIRPYYLKKIENGTAYGVLLNRHLLKIANALDVKLSYLFED